MTFWPALRLSSTSCADGPLADARHEVLDDPEVDVRLEQRKADLAHRGVDVRLGDAAVAGQAAEDATQSFGKIVKQGIFLRRGLGPGCALNRRLPASRRGPNVACEFTAVSDLARLVWPRRWRSLPTLPPWPTNR